MEKVTEEQQRLVRENSGLIHLVAGKFRVNGQPIVMEELKSAGSLALCEAAQSYEAAKGSFSTYASECIKNAMIDCLDRNGSLTTYMQGQIRKLEDARQKLSMSLGREASEDELAKELGWTIKQVRNVAGNTGTRNIRSLDQLMEDGEEAVGKLTSDSDRPEDDYIAKETAGRMQTVVAEALAGLDDCYREAVRLRYIFGKSPEQTAKELGLTRAAVDYRCNKALSLLGRNRQIRALHDDMER